jgi:hypothetical protein
MDFSKIILNNLDGPVSFCPTAKQKLLLNTITETNVTSILTRQQGFSTAQVIAVIQNAFDNPGTTSMFISHNNSMNVHLLDTATRMIFYMGRKDEMLRHNKNRIELMNGSIITMTSPVNASQSLRGRDMGKLFVAIDLMLMRKNIYEVTLLIQMLIQMRSRFSVGLMLSPPKDVSKKVMKIFNVKLTILMTMLRYNSTFIDFPVENTKSNPYLSPEDFKREYELFPFKVLSEDPTDTIILEPK